MEELENELENVATWHIMHLVFTLITGGFWIPIWVVCGLRNNQIRSKLNDRINRIQRRRNAAQKD